VFRRFSIALILLLFFSLASFAQNTTATLRGTVHDPSGASLSGAFVTVTNSGTHTVNKAVTNNNGDYTVLELPIGTYSVTIEANGFDTRTYTGIILNVDQNARVDASLKVGSLNQIVAVDATQIQIQSEDATNGKLLSGRELQELPSNNRNIWQEAQFLPQVSATVPSDSLANRGGFVVAGITSSNNNYLVDGIDNNDWTTGQPTTRPSTDAVSDYRIITGQAPAEYGEKNGGQVVVNTRGGTNQWHGSAFFFYRDGKWNAPLYDFGYPTINPVPTSVSRQFGVSVGGPIVKDRTFFWVTYEATRASEDPGVIGYTPLPSWYGGSNTSDGNAQFTSPTPLYNPANGQQFAQTAPGVYEIPFAQITSDAQALFQYFPQATTTTTESGQTVGEFANHKPNTQSENQGTFRIDQKFSQNDSIFGVYSFLKGLETGTVGDFVVSNAVTPGFGAYSPHLYQHAAIGWDHIFTPNLVNSFRFGFNRFDAYYKNQDAGLGNVAGALGLPQGNPYLNLPNNGNTGVPSFAVSGLSSIGTGSNPQWRGDNTVPLAESLTWVHGNHTYKVGLQAVDFFKHSFYIPGGRGTYNFSGQYTAGTGASGNTQQAFADFLLGYISSDSYQAGIEDQYPIQHSGGLYAEDEYKVVPSLTLNYGLRWDYFSPVREAYNNISYFNSTTNLVYTGKGPVYDLNTPGSPLYTTAVPSGNLNQVGTVPSRRDNYAAIYHNFAPRIGFAYRLHNTDSTVIRGGYGIYYGLPQIQTWNSANGLGTPFLIPKSFTGATDSKTTHEPAPTATTPILTVGPGAFGSTGTQPLNSTGVTTIDPHIKTLYSQQYSLGIQHQVGKIVLLELSYQGSRTLHNISSLSINQPTLAQRQANPALATVVNSLRPFNTIGSDSAWSSISVIGGGLAANYNSLLINAQRRFENGLTFQSYLVYSKSLEEGNVVNDPAYPTQYNYGPAATDQKFRSVTTGLYNLPFGKGQHFLSHSPSYVSYVVSGWQATTVLTLQSGRPFSTSTNDTYASFTGNGGHAFINPGGSSPNAAIDTATGGKTHTVKDWYNTGAFRSNDPANGAALTNAGVTATSDYVYNYGNGGYDNIRGPGLQDVDFGLIKQVRFDGTQSVEFKAEAFNLLNHPNFANPSAAYGGTGPDGTTPNTTGVITSTVAAGTPTATGANRQLQLSLRYAF
jgi:hypothetical protein